MPPARTATVGVPAATWLGQTLGWRASYWLVAGLAALTMAMVLAFVPDCPSNPEATGRRELQALRMPQVWFAVVAGAVGFGGMFALFSYVAPITTLVADLPESAVPLFLAGCALGYLTLPKAVHALLGFTPDGATNILPADTYLNFVLKFILAFGLAFLLPVFLVGLNAAGVLPARVMLRGWRPAVFLIFLFAAIMTPSPDPWSMLFLAFPMVGLFFSMSIEQLLKSSPAN